MTQNALRVTGGGIEAQANTMLAAINADNLLANPIMAMDWTVGVLSNPTWQDYAVTTGLGNPPVPEPLTMASAFFAIGGLGAYIRRRTSAAK